MIKNIPTKADYERAAISRLNLAWESVGTLLEYMGIAEISTWDDDGSVTKEFWLAAQQSLGNAHALIHQGIELLLKGHVAAVSPFLLLERQIRDWPTRRPDWIVDFAEFRTVDAADLIKLFNIVCPQPLPEAFSLQIDSHRAIRNAFTHSTGLAKNHDAVELWKTILEVTHQLIGPQRWFPLRAAYLKIDPAFIAFGNDGSFTVLAKEAELLFKALSHAERTKYLGWDGKARTYICYHCAMDTPDADLRPRTAQLKPNDPSATCVECFACGQKTAVNREKCQEDGCQSNVITSHDHVCLCCFSEQEHD